MQGKEAFLFVLQWIINATAIVGNGLVIYLITFRQELHSKANWFVLSLALADLFVGVTFLPYYRACKEEFCYQRHIHWLCVDVFLCTSVTNLCLLTVDRYIAIVKPLKYLTIMTQRRVVFGILAAWCIPAATALLPLSWTYLAKSMAQRSTWHADRLWNYSLPPPSPCHCAHLDDSSKVSLRTMCSNGSVRFQLF